MYMYMYNEMVKFVMGRQRYTVKLSKGVDGGWTGGGRGVDGGE